jgi:hypothetical protein
VEEEEALHLCHLGVECSEVALGGWPCRGRGGWPACQRSHGCKIKEKGCRGSANLSGRRHNADRIIQTSSKLCCVQVRVTFTAVYRSDKRVGPCHSSFHTCMMHVNVTAKRKTAAFVKFVPVLTVLHGAKLASQPPTCSMYTIARSKQVPPLLVAHCDTHLLLQSCMVPNSRARL